METMKQILEAKFIGKMLRETGGEIINKKIVDVNLITCGLMNAGFNFKLENGHCVFVSMNTPFELRDEHDLPGYEPGSDPQIYDINQKVMVTVDDVEWFEATIVKYFGDGDYEVENDYGHTFYISECDIKEIQT